MSVNNSNSFCDQRSTRWKPECAGDFRLPTGHRQISDKVYKYRQYCCNRQIGLLYLELGCGAHLVIMLNMN